jgi:hypothetical protein
MGAGICSRRYYCKIAVNLARISAKLEMGLEKVQNKDIV